MKGNLLGLLGICRKAGKLRLGFDPVAAGLGKDVLLLLFTSDISEKTQERMLKKADGLPVKWVNLSQTSDEVYNAIGKRVAVMAVTDKGLADKAASLAAVTQDPIRENLSPDKAARD